MHVSYMHSSFSSSPRQGIISGLRDLDDETSQLAALSELNEMLSISTEESLVAFPAESVVPLLVSARC